LYPTHALTTPLSVGVIVAQRKIQGTQHPSHTLKEMGRLLTAEEQVLAGRKAGRKQQHCSSEDAEMLKDELNCLQEAIAALKKGKFSLT